MDDRTLVIMHMSGPDDGRELHFQVQHGDGSVDADGTWSLVCGRRDECDLSIPFDTKVSRRHATLRVTTQGEIWLTDERSLNGTFVANRRIEAPTQLQPGQLFRMGRTWLRIQPKTDESA